LLWTLAHRASMPPLPQGTAGPRDPALSDRFYAAIGCMVLGERFLRVDRVESLLAAARRLSRQGPFGVTAELAQIAGAPIEDVPRMLGVLGYRAVADAEGQVIFHGRPRHPGKRARPESREPHAEAERDNPFAKLRALRFR
jgi:hypothetical protein